MLAVGKFAAIFLPEDLEVFSVVSSSRLLFRPLRFKILSEQKIPFQNPKSVSELDLPNFRKKILK